MRGFECVMNGFGPLIALLLLSSAALGSQPLVETRAGVVLGETLPGPAHAFRGIPYAAAPVGELRWKRPVEHPRWEGTRPCRAFGPACPQPAGGRALRGTIEPQAEACLTLNLWTPALDPEARLPVLCWIHGGGMVVGASSLGIYDGARLAGRGVVVVSLNYRLGPLGFLAHPWLSRENAEKVSGNYGLWDQIAALRWIRENIARFGGDPGRVTLFGESAGAVSIACLLVALPAKGLFSGAILQSGTAAAVQTTLQEAEAAGEALAASLGAVDLERLRAAAPEALLAAAPPKVGLFGPGVSYGPVVDGHLLPAAPHAMIAEGRFHGVPLIIGTNADEATLFLDRLPVRRSLGYQLLVRRLFGANAPAVLELFPVASEQEVLPALNRLVTASAFIAPARALARHVARHEGSVWLYHFTRVPPIARLSRKGAAHGLEIPYLFGTGGVALAGPVDRALSEALAGLWVAFAREGMPAAPGVPEWPRYSVETDQYLELGATIRVGAGLRKRECDLFDRIRGFGWGALDPRPGRPSAPEGEGTPGTPREP